MSYSPYRLYHNVSPIAYPDEQFVPVPGWGMRPELAGSRVIAVGGLGTDIPITTPIGTTSVSIPIDQIVSNAIDAAWPAIKIKLDAETDSILIKAQPKLRTEIDRGLGEARTTGYTLAFILVAAIAASAWWVRSKK